MYARNASSKAPAAPHFPIYLLPSLKIPFFRRRQSSDTTASSPVSNKIPSLSSSPTSVTSVDYLSESPINISAEPDVYPFDISGDAAFKKSGPNQPEQASSSAVPSHGKLAFTLPDLIRCRTCGTDIAYGLQVVSKSFTGRHGRALLVSPPPATATPSCPSYIPSPPSVSKRSNDISVSPGHHTLARDGADLVNIIVGRPEPRNLVTGAHVVADINCATCGVKIGWKYVDAREQAQKYKVGKFILETERVVLFRSWEDIRPGDEEASHGHFYSQSAPAASFNGRRKSFTFGGARKHSISSEPTSNTSDYVVEEEHSESESERDVTFDSDDEDECEDIFMGVWDAATVARRRNSKASNRQLEKKGTIKR